MTLTVIGLLSLATLLLWLEDKLDKRRQKNLLSKRSEKWRTR